MRKIDAEPGNIAFWLNKALTTAGLSQAELARQLTSKLGYTIDRSTVSKMMHEQRKVSADEMMACIAVLGRTLPPPWEAQGAAEGIAPAKNHLDASAISGVYVQPEGQAFSLEEESGDAWIFSAGQEAKSSLYAVDVVGTDMAPRYRPGERIWIDPGKPIKSGGDVFIQRIDARTKRLADGLIRQFVAWQKDELVLARCSSDQQERYPRQRIIFVHPILFCSRA